MSFKRPNEMNREELIAHCDELSKTWGIQRLSQAFRDDTSNTEKLRAMVQRIFDRHEQ